MVYFYLFISAFISATLFPLGSEALLIFYIQEKHNILALLAVACIGNTLGSVLNYYLGLKGEEFLEKRSLLKKEKIEKSKKFFDKYGAFSLLLAWVPVIGDPITFVAGILKYDFKKFLFLVFISKSSRYIFLALITLNLV